MMSMLLATLLACSQREAELRAEPSAEPAAAIAQAAPSAPAPAATAAAMATPPLTAAAPRHLPVVVFLGDSLTAGYGVAVDEAFPARVAELLRDRGTPIRMLNAGVSGDTSAGGLRRLDWVLKQHPDVLVVELGANDGLRGQPVAGIESNLRAVIERARAGGAAVLLLGIRVPPSLGGAYANEFAAVYPRVASDLHVPFVPFFLEGVGGRPELNQPDGIHPNVRGHQLVANNVLPALTNVLRARATAETAAR